MKPHNELMESIIKDIQSQLKTSMFERMDDMLTAWQDSIEEAQANEEEALPPLKLSMSASANIDKQLVETSLKFAVTYQSKTAHPMPDPNQPELPIDGEEDEA